MARYFFDVHDKKLSTIDVEGMECADRDAVSHEVLQLLCVIAKENPLEHMHNQLSAIVRNTSNHVVLTASITLSTTWVDEA